MTTQDAGKLAIRKKKRMKGTVVSARMHKTVVVRCLRISRHSVYGKVLRKAIKFKVHDEKSLAGVGDLVEIEPTRPLSKEKYFRLVEVIKKSQLEQKDDSVKVNT